MANTLKKLKTINTITGILTCLLLSSCSKVKFYPDKPLTTLNNKIAHRGGGGTLYRDNTIEACTFALKDNDGVEIDIQISKDRTIWMAHDATIKLCDGSSICFAETKDADIEKIDSCNGRPIGYSKLEELLEYVKNNCPEKYIIVDLKGWIPCSGNSAGIEGMMRLEAELVSKMAKKHNLSEKVLIETDIVSVLLWARRFTPEIGQYLNVYGNLEKGMLTALNQDLDGIAFKTNVKDTLTRDYVNLFHKKGLRLIAWNLSDTSELSKYLRMGVDFTEYDLP